MEGKAKRTDTPVFLLLPKIIKTASREINPLKFFHA